MALQATDLLIVQRNQQSYKMPASEISSFVPPAPNVGDGTITIVQPGTTNQTFTVNQSGPTTITLKNDNTNTEYSAGNGLSLSGTTFSAKAGNNTITIDSAGIKVNTANIGINPGTVTSITPGEGIRNGASTGAANSTAITSSGSLSVDDTVVRTSGNQTIAGAKTFSDNATFGGDLNVTGNAAFVASQIAFGPGGSAAFAGGNIEFLSNGSATFASVVTPAVTLNGSAWSLTSGNVFLAGAVSIPNPSNIVAGATGTFVLSAAPSSWGNQFKFPDGGGNTYPGADSYPAVVPYVASSTTEILLGTPIAY